MDRNRDLLDAHRYASEMLIERKMQEAQEAEREEKKAMEIMAAARRVDLSTLSAATMSSGAAAKPMDIEFLLKHGKVTDVEVAFDTGRHIVRINRKKVNEFFNELGIILKSPDVKFTEDDLKWLCESFMVLTDMTEQARTVSTARFGE
jgi:hypothetical protein